MAIGTGVIGTKVLSTVTTTGIIMDGIITDLRTTTTPISIENTTTITRRHEVIIIDNV